MNTMMFEGFKLFTITFREIGGVADIQITSQWAPHLSVWSLGPLTSMAVCNQSVQVVNIRPIKNTLDRIRVVYYYKQLISRMDIPGKSTIFDHALVEREQSVTAAFSSKSTREDATLYSLPRP